MKDILRLIVFPVALIWNIGDFARIVLWNCLQAIVLSLDAFGWWCFLRTVLILLDTFCECSANTFHILNTTPSVFKGWYRSRDEEGLSQYRLGAPLENFGYWVSGLLALAIIIAPIQTGHSHWTAIAFGSILLLGAVVAGQGQSEWEAEQRKQKQDARLSAPIVF